MLSWSLATGSTRSCHPRAGAPHYSVVSIQHVLHVAPMLPLFREPIDAPGSLSFLVTDKWDL